jgi:hypothetical protein
LRLLVSILLSLAAASVSAAQAKAATCPTQSFLVYANLVYAGESPPSSASVAPGGSLGDGTLDEPTDQSGCSRKRSGVEVVRLAGLDPAVAVGVRGRDRAVFVLGGRCSGLARDARWRCLQHPLRFRGRAYVGVSYPPPGKDLRVGRRVGKAVLAGTTVPALGIAGVAPSVAVAVAGRPDVAFVAPGACPYERFSVRPLLDDLRRCLAGPVWLVFDPPGARAGASVQARADRRVTARLSGSAITLERLRSVADVVPRDPAAHARLGRLSTGTLTFELPNVPPGLYEAVVTCSRCASAYGGRTEFPAGSVLVGPRKSGSSGPRIVAIVLGLLVLVLGILAAVVFRRRRRSPSTGSGPAAP